MNQTEWITALRQALRGLPREDVERSVGFYEEAIQDRVEEGCTEEQAVAAIGTPRDIADQILAEIPLTKLVRKKVAPTRAFRPWEIILLILGAPLWLTLLLEAVSVFRMPLYHVLQEGAVHGVHQVNDGVLVLGQVKELVVGQGDAFGGGRVVDVGHH